LNRISELIPKVVIDTNIYISAIFWGGKPREVIDLDLVRVDLCASALTKIKMRKIAILTISFLLCGKR